jgi:hypothetical protein
MLSFHPDIFSNLIHSFYPDALAISFQHGISEKERKAKAQDI